MAFKIGDLLGWVQCPWRWGESEWGACSQAASLASGVCGPAVSHADRVPLFCLVFFFCLFVFLFVFLFSAFPPAQQSFLFFLPPRALSVFQRCNSISPLVSLFLNNNNKKNNGGRKKKKKKKKKKKTTTMWSPLSNPAAASSASPRSRLWALFSSYRGALSSVPLPVGLPSVAALFFLYFLFLAATDWAEHRGWRRNTVVTTRAISLHSDIAKSLPPRLELPYKLSMKKWEWRRCTWCWKRKLHRREREI